MKYLGFILGIAGIYFYFFHQAPSAEVKAVVTGEQAVAIHASAPDATPVPTNSLKRPLDRTKEVLGQVQQRNGHGEF